MAQQDITNPDIIKEKQQNILEIIKSKAPHYTPEWTFEDGTDAGVALSKIFAYMAELAIKRLNIAPQNHFLSFLDMINASLIPAQSARAPLTFELSKGTSENVLIPASTQVSAPGPDGKTILFETENNIMATPASLKYVVSAIKEDRGIQDSIFDHTIAINGGGTTELFMGENKQEHVLYIGDKNLLNIKKGKIIILGKGLEKLIDTNVTWEYSVKEISEKKNGNEIKKIYWQQLNLDEFGTKIDSKITLIKDPVAGEPNDVVALNGYASRWIKCRVNDSKINEVKDIILSNLTISPSPLEEDGIFPDLAFFNDVPIDLSDPAKQFYPFGSKPQIFSSFYIASKDAFSKKDYKVSLIIDLIPGSPTSHANKPKLSWEYWDGMGWSPFEGVNEDFVSSPVHEGTAQSGDYHTIQLSATAPGNYNGMKIEITGGKCSGQIRKIINYIEGTKTATVDSSWDYSGPDTTSTYVIYPCQIFSPDHEATAQSGNSNTITLSTNASETSDYYNKMKIEITGGKCSGQIRKIINYDGGTKVATVDPSWDSQVPDNNSTYIIYTDITINSMPELKPVSVNGKENYWIRIRLIEGGYGREYEIQGYEVKPGYFCPPVIKSIRIKYDAPEQVGFREPEYVFTKNNLKFSEFRETLNLSSWDNISDNDKEKLKEFLEKNYDINWIKKARIEKIEDDITISTERNSLTLKINGIAKNRITLRIDDGRTDEFFVSKKNGELIINRLLNPFETLTDEDPAMYFGFDRALKGGTFSFLIHIDEKFVFPDDFHPRIRWTHKINDGTWKEINTLIDETGGFTRSGMVRFDVSDEMITEKLFGSADKLYWLRAEITENFFNLTTQTAQQQGIVNPSLMGNEAKKSPPKVMGFFLNSAWSIQSRIITDEIIGSGTGEGRQKFNVLNLPVITAQIWVNEIEALTETERLEIKDAMEIKDDKGNVVQFWVKWKEVSDFIESKMKDRHFMIDKTAGEIKFGDGNRGMVPPTGQNNIKATYRTGGGKSGNLDALKIAKLQTAVPFVDKVKNPIASDGGTDNEEIDALIERAPIVLKHRDRAVALEDFRWLTKQASRKVARVKVLPNFDSVGDFKTGYVTVVIVPHSSDIKPIPSPELRNRVRIYLQARCPNVITLNVIQPYYYRTSICALLFTDDIDAIPVIERDARIKMIEFLHPLTGGIEGKGWSFGSIPCISDIYSVLEHIMGVDYVVNVEIQLQPDNDMRIIKITENAEIIKIPEFALLYSGEHVMKAQWKGGNESAIT